MTVKREQTQKNDPALLHYRMDKLEDAVETIGTALAGIDKSLEALTSLEQRHAAVQDSVSRLFSRLETSENEIRRLDEEMKKWFNRGVGVASVASLLFVLIGGYVGNELNKVSDAIKAVPTITKQAESQKKLNKLMMRKLGLDHDLLDLE